jgi:hypothetical protein
VPLITILLSDVGKGLVRMCLKCGPLPGGAVGPLGGACCLYEGHIYLDEIRAQLKIYILVGTLLG